MNLEGLTGKLKQGKPDTSSRINNTALFMFNGGTLRRHLSTGCALSLVSSGAICDLVVRGGDAGLLSAVFIAAHRDDGAVIIHVGEACRYYDPINRYLSGYADMSYGRATRPHCASSCP